MTEMFLVTQSYLLCLLNEFFNFVTARDLRKPGGKRRKTEEKEHWSVFSKACAAFQSKVEESDAAFYFGRFVGQKLKGMTEDRQTHCMMEIMTVLCGSTNETQSNNKISSNATASAEMQRMNTINPAVIRSSMTASSQSRSPSSPFSAPAPTAHKVAGRPQVVLRYNSSLIPSTLGSAPPSNPATSNIRISSSSSGVNFQQEPLGFITPDSQVQSITIFVASPFIEKLAEEHEHLCIFKEPIL